MDDKATALFCTGGVYQMVPCKGPRGCQGGTSHPQCDASVADEGDPCMAEGERYACDTEKRRALVCKAGKYTLWRSCRGPAACKAKDTSEIECDNTLGEPSDPCATGQLACSADHKKLLKCRDEKLEIDSTCRGPKECAIQADRLPFCDNTIALEGDACSHEGSVACSVDAKSELVCNNHRFVKKQECKRKGGCAIKEGSLFCAF